MDVLKYILFWRQIAYDDWKKDEADWKLHEEKKKAKKKKQQVNSSTSTDLYSQTPSTSDTTRRKS